LQKRIGSISETLRLVQNNAAWLGDSQNAQRVAGFIRTLSSEKNAKAMGDLLARIDRMEAWQQESQMVLRANLLEDTQRRMIEVSRLLNNLPKEQREKTESRGNQAFNKWDAYIRGEEHAK
jgi:hypothetical protein